MSGPHGERQPGRDDDGVVADTVLAHHAVQVGRHGLQGAGDDVQPFPVMPQVRMGGEGLVLLHRAERHESETESCDQWAEVRAGGEGDVVPAAPQRERQPDIWVHVACAADGNQEYAHR